MKRITPQQKIFIREYVKTLNAEQSLESAGYKVKNKSEFARKLLTDCEIVKEIKKELHSQIKSLRVEKGYVVQKLLQIAEFSLEPEDILDKDGNLTGKQKLRDTSAGLKALESLAKYLGFSNPSPTCNELPKIITVENLDTDKI